MPDSTRETVYVWECLGEPGDYALCTDSQCREFQNPNWRFRSELAGVYELHDLSRSLIDNRTVNGWALVVHKDQHGSYGIREMKEGGHYY
jgi:hypothetical protein